MLGALLLIALLAGGAAAGESRYRNPTVGRELALQIPGMHRAVVKRNVVYARRAGRALKLDVYRPRGARAGQRFAPVLLVHGTTSDPSPKDWGVYVGWGQLLAASGLTGIPFNHRGEGGDVEAALAYVRRHSGALGVDPGRICIASFSGGVPIGLRVALLDGSIACALVFYGEPDPALLRAASPPIFAAKAGLDADYVNDALDRLRERALEIGATVELVTHARGVHGFDVRNHDARSRTILRQAVAFARARLLPARGSQVTFRASDGVRLAGRSFGGGDVGVVLSHMGRHGDTAADWYRLARALAERGYTALAYNRRGVCSRTGRECSGGVDVYASSWKDVVGAAAFLRARGARKLVLVGASIGGMASLHALVTRRLEAAAFVEIGGVNHASGYDFSRQQLEALEGHKLFVSAAGDVYGGAETAREWHGWAREPKQLAILPGSAHGTDLLREGQPTARPLTELILAFLARAAPPR
jgi:dienelactone hydrolase